jgi:hypothetical protein
MTHEQLRELFKVSTMLLLFFFLPRRCLSRVNLTGQTAVIDGPPKAVGNLKQWVVLAKQAEENLVIEHGTVMAHSVCFLFFCNSRFVVQLSLPVTLFNFFLVLCCCFVSFYPMTHAQFLLLSSQAARRLQMPSLARKDASTGTLATTREEMVWGIGEVLFSFLDIFSFLRSLLVFLIHSHSSFFFFFPSSSSSS